MVDLVVDVVAGSFAVDVVVIVDVLVVDVVVIVLVLACWSIKRRSV